jgi:type IV secretion system protein VirD4
MFVNLCLGAFESGSLRHEFQHRAGRLPVLMILDEFASMGTMTRLADAAGQVAGLGCKLWPILQDMGQLKSLYKDRWETFLANAGVITFFGNQDLTTLEWIQKRLGDTTITNFSQSQQAVDAAVRGGASGASYSMATHPLLSIPEIARIFNRDDPMLRQLVISGAHGALVLQRAFYDKHEALLSLRARGARPG